MSCQSPHLRSVVDADGAVILDLERNSMLTLNSTGGYILDKLQQGKAVDDIIRELADETFTDLAIVERDVRDFLDELKSKRLVATRTKAHS